jgi:serine/threonine protein kinase
MEKNDIENIKNELQLLISIRHPNIINIIGYSFNNNYNDIYLIFEYKKYSLKNLLENNSINFTIKQKLKIIYEIALAISYLHSRENKIYHRDLKSGNILLDENYNCFICDFGMSKYNKKNNSYNNLYKTNSQSTPYWMAPEFICEGLFNEKSDIYSFGILIWEIFMKDTIPYKNVNLFDFILGNKDVIYNIRPVILDNKIKDCLEIKYLIEKMWDNDMKKRPDINEVVDFIEKLREKYNID